MEMVGADRRGRDGGSGKGVSGVCVGLGLVCCGSRKRRVWGCLLVLVVVGVIGGLEMEILVRVWWGTVLGWDWYVVVANEVVFMVDLW